jgi:hypothetical protein
MGQTFRYVEQVTGDENPIGVKLPHGFDDTIMPRIISIEMEVREMDRAMAAESAVREDVPRNLMDRKTEFPLRDKAERPIEWLAYTITDTRSHAIRP